MANSIVGKIKAISKQEVMKSKNGTEFVKQCVFLDNSHYDQDTGEKYENDLLLEFINPKDGDIAQRFKVGDRVQISFRLRGYSFESKQTAGKKEYGVSVSCFRIEPFQSQNNGASNVQAQQPAQSNNPFPASSPAPNTNNQGAANSQQSDDLPF